MLARPERAKAHAVQSARPPAEAPYTGIFFSHISYKKAQTGKSCTKFYVALSLGEKCFDSVGNKGRFGRCDAGRRFFAAAGTRAGKAARTPPVMRIDGHGILWPRMRLNGGKRRPAGGRAERRLCFAVASNVPFAVKAVESETREGASSALPQCADPQRFREFISSAERKLPALSRGRLHRATRYLSAAAPCRRSSAA